MDAFSVYARETDEINRQAAAIRSLRLEMEAERLAWERKAPEEGNLEALKAAREEWAHDAHAVAEFERWHLDCLISETDAGRISESKSQRIGDHDG